jgi:dynactin 1
LDLTAGISEDEGPHPIEEPIPKPAVVQVLVDANGESMKEKDARIHTLTTSLKLLNNRHQASMEDIRMLQAKVDSAEQFISARPKLTQKLQQLQNELTSTRTLLQEAEAQQKTMENRLIDLSERLEMEMLERELCEEREEQAIEEREELRRRLGELEGELALLQDEQSRLEGSGLEDLVRFSLLF